MSYYFFSELLSRIIIIIMAPVRHPEMVWMLLPMIITLLLMTFYFGRHRREELGWNTAFGNAIVLLFVSLNMFQVIFPGTNPFQALLIFIRRLFVSGFGGEGIMAGVVAGAIMLYAFLLLAADFFHWLPKKVAFFISSGLPINTLAYFGIIFVYTAVSDSPMPLDWLTLLAFFVLFIVLFLFLTLVRSLVPYNDVKDLLEEAPAPSKKREAPPLPEDDYAIPEPLESFDGDLNGPVI